MKASVGIDLVEVKRFKPFKEHSPFIQKVFFQSEIKYCFSFKDFSTHLAGTYAAKEAVSKALGVAKFPFAEIEIIRDKQGKPSARHKGKKLPIEISISHTGSLATAIAV